MSDGPCNIGAYDFFGEESLHHVQERLGAILILVCVTLVC